MHVASPMLAAARLIGWMLVHSLWQGLVIAVAYGCCRSVTGRGEGRYRLGLAAMGTLVLMQAVTLSMLWRADGSLPEVGNLTLPGVMLSAGGVARTPVLVGPPSIIQVDAALPWITMAWSIGVLVLALRAALQWLDLRQLVRSAQASPIWQRRLERLAVTFGLSGRVKILCSDAVGSPVLIGLLRPVILLPIAVTCRMTILQLELVLAHELAHVRRLDPLFNLLQITIETLYFHHPMVRWVSRQVRNEREVCTDLMVLSRYAGRRRDYIEALATLSELQQRHPMILASNGGLLLERVQLIASTHQPVVGHGSPVRVLAAALGVALAVGVAWRQSSHAPPAIAWPMESVQLLRIRLEGLARPPSWSFADLTPLRTATAYPVASVEDDPLPAVQGDSAASPLQLHDLDIGSSSLATMDLTDRKIALAASASVGIEASSVAVPGPKPLRVQEPIYPRRALEAGIEGSVVIEFGVDQFGAAREMRVIRSTPEGIFDSAALDALRHWRYAEPLGSDLALRYRQAISFTLGNQVSRQTDRREGRGELPCTVVTGTHICRAPEL